MARIKLDGVEKVYDNGFHAVHNLDLDVPDGEFLVLVGPSGCGKSTALRMVAGLESISAGRLYIDDRDVTELEPKDRDIAMVFQSYALYPHLTVRDNIAFALKLRKVPKEEIARKVDEAARLLELTDQLDRRPGQLSGGQRQRVAMGRAIVRAPKVFLMDEPLSNLDAKLRVQMRAEISKLQRSLGVTTIYVTHDQVEAMTMGDRVAVLWAGRLQQVASPQELYDRPDNAFVAGFIGSPSMNLLIGAVQRSGPGWSVQLGEQSLALPADVVAERPALAGYDGRKIIVGIRPEHVHDVALRDGVARLHGEVQVRESLGSEVVLHLEIGATKAAVGVDEAGGSAFIARLDPRTALRTGDHAELAVDTQYVQLFDAESGQAIRG